MLKFTEKEQITKFIREKDLKILNLCHIPEDGRLKTLSFSAANKDRTAEILNYGERVDGSNLFSFITPGKSDIYVMPRIDKAFINPFAKTGTLNILCDYLDENGKPLDIAPKNILARAEKKLHASNHVTLKALAELEFYVIAKQENLALFPGTPDKNYHESAPFTKFEDLRSEVLATLAEAGIATKYAHGEVGLTSYKDNTLIEQHEVEFTPQNLADIADTIAVAKWMIRNVSAKHGVSVSFSPKIALDHAGTGMHIHLCALKNGENIIANSNGALSTEAKKMIGSLLKFAPSLAAFGNPTPISYLRFIARKESPMHICWSYRNRLALIRIPLWWSFKKASAREGSCRETFEYRAPDAFANVYLLLAGIALAVDYGLNNPKQTLKIAKDWHIEETGKKRKKLEVLPLCCAQAANNLLKDRKFYEANEVFPKIVIDKTVEKLRAFKDAHLWKSLEEKPETAETLVQQYLHYG